MRSALALIDYYSSRSESSIYDGVFYNDKISTILMPFLFNSSKKFESLILIFALLCLGLLSSFALPSKSDINTTSEFLSPPTRLNRVGFAKMYAENTISDIVPGSPSPGFTVDVLSFANYGVGDVDMSGWQIYTDNEGVGSPVYTFPSGTIISPCQELFIVSRWIGSVPLPTGWLDAGFTGNGGFFADNVDASNYAILRNPSSDDYISIHNLAVPPTLPTGISQGDVNLSNLVPDSFEPCELIYWEDNANQYLSIISCTVPNFITSCLTSDIESISNYTGFGVSCAGGDDGWIKAKAQGGTPPYNFEWRDNTNTIISTGVIDSIFGLTAGFYSVTISDQAGLIGFYQTTLQQPSTLQSQALVIRPFDGQAISCPGAEDGSAFVFSFSGAIDQTTGAPPYSYQWSDGQTGDTLRNVGPGTYTVITTDANGCTDVDSLVINDLPEWGVEISQTSSIPCDGTPIGQIQALTTGTVGNVEFEWSTGDVGNVLSGLGEGEYIVTATSNPGCIRRDTFFLSTPPQIDIAFTSTFPSSCGANDGEIIAQITGGTPPFNFVQWNTGVAGSTLSNITEGTYTLTVVDILGCSITETFVLTDPSCTGVGAGFCDGGIVVNEIFQNGTTGASWIELLVVGDPSNPTGAVNLEGWIVDDNNGDYIRDSGPTSMTQGALGLGSFWSSTTPGTIILIYDENNKDPDLPADDPLDFNGDGIRVLPANHFAFFGCSDAPNSLDPTYLFCNGVPGSWSYIDLLGDADVVQTISFEKNVFHAVSWGNMIAPFPTTECGDPTIHIDGVLSNNTIHFDCGDWTNVDNYSRTSGLNKTGGIINSGSNQTTADLLNSGGFDYGDPDNAAHCVEGNSNSGSCIPGLIVNELFVNNANTVSWMELLVVGNAANPTAPVNLEGWLIDDNNGEFFRGGVPININDGALGLGNHWSAVAPGSIILIYDERGDRDARIPPDDFNDTNGDDIYVIPGDHWSLFACSAAPNAGNTSYVPCDGTTPSWEFIEFQRRDVVQVRASNGVFFHGYAFGDFDTPTVEFACGGTTWSFGLQLNNRPSLFLCGDWFERGNYTRPNSTGRTPASTNTQANLVTISKIRSGDFDYNNPDDPIHCVDPSITGIGGGVCTQGPGLVINELNLGLFNDQEWVELLVLGDPDDPLAPVDLNGWLFDDNNGEFSLASGGSEISNGALGFGSSWNNVLPGSVIVVYNESNKDPDIPADDPLDSNNDGVYILPADHGSLFGCSNAPTSFNPSYASCNGAAPTWAFVELGVAGDAFQVRTPTNDFFQGFSFGNINDLFPSNTCSESAFGFPTATQGTILSLNCGDWLLPDNYDEQGAIQKTPGLPNSNANLTLIINIKSGAFNYSDRGTFNNCLFEPSCFLAANGNQFLTGFDHIREFETTLASYSNTSVMAIEFDPLSDSLFGADANTLIYINNKTGATSPIGQFSSGAQANGPQGNIDFNNIHGIARDPVSDIWYASQRIDGATPCGNADVLFQFDKKTGGYITGAFNDSDFNGLMDDYVVIQPPTGNTCLNLITDLTYDPFNARIYGLATGTGIHANTVRLVQINAQNGSTIDRGVIEFDAGSGIEEISDIKGISITTNDRMFVTTGTGSNFPNQIFEITGFFAGEINTSYVNDLSEDDYQAITCQTFATLSSVGGIVYRDINANGTFDLTELGISDVEVFLIQSINRDTIGTIDTDLDGVYSFENVYPGEYEVVITNGNFLFSGALNNHVILGDPDAEIDGMTITNGLSFGDVFRDLNFGYNTEENCANGIDDNFDGLVDCFDPFCQNFNDFDGDGLGLFCDLDDDNDGITDLIEDNVIVVDYIPSCGDDPDFDFSNPQLISGVDRNEGATYRYSDVIPGVDAVVTLERILNITVPTIDDESVTPERFQPQSTFVNLDVGEEAYQQYHFDFVIAGTFRDTVLDAFNLFFIDIDGNSQYSETNFTENPSSFTYNDPTELDFVRTDQSILATGGNNEFLAITDQFPQANFFTRYVRTTEIRFRFGVAAMQNNVNALGRQHGLIFTCPSNFTGPITVSIDIDEDGIPNYIDLDSDNDGIYDAHEAGHDLAVDAEGRIQGVNGFIGNNGLDNRVETSADSDDLDYTVADSDVTPNGTFDAYQLDSDGDGCFDVLEALYVDQDNDGLVDQSPLEVDVLGRAVVHTFAQPSTFNWRDPLIVGCIEICDDGLDNDLNGVVDCIQLIGRVFEDINYGGGDGRNYITANESAMSSGWVDSDIAVQNAIVELYDESGAFITSTTTDALGNYEFQIIDLGQYAVRVANESIRSNRGTNGTGQTPIAVQTFRTDGETNITAEVGGRVPSFIDAPVNSTGQDLSSLSTASSTVQSFARIFIDTMVGATMIPPTLPLDFGYNFDVVVNTNNEGQGSLRQFIINSNELNNVNLDQEDDPLGGISFPKEAGIETSLIEITSPGAQIINPLFAYDAISDSHTHVTGYTHDASNPGPIDSRDITIELNGGGLNFDAFDIRSNSVSISGLSVHGYRRAVNSNSNINDLHVWGNYIGVLEDGSAVPSGFGNGSNGLELRNVSDSYIGTDYDGVDDTFEGNIVSASNANGIFLQSTSEIRIGGNYIGLDRSGDNAIANNGNGILIEQSSGVNYIGVDDNQITSGFTNFRNIISGNINHGIRLNDANNVVVAGNYIGTNRSGLGPVGNNNYGVQIERGTSNTQIGTDGDGNMDDIEANVISGNRSGYRSLPGGWGSNNVIAGNFIGTDASGFLAVPNLDHGMEVLSFQQSRVGTNGDGVSDQFERNIISGNNNDGIRIDNNAGNTTVAGNYIGVASNGQLPLANGDRGIFIGNNSNDNRIGYHPSMAVSDAAIVGNKVRYNVNSGIVLASNNAQRNRISRNSIGFNGGLGIDLNDDGVSTNDNGDFDFGSNSLLNFPVFTMITFASDSTVTVSGFASGGATLELFGSDGELNPNPLPASYSTSFGEGLVYIGSAVEGSGNDLSNEFGSYTDDGTGAIFNRNQNQFEFVFDVSGTGIGLGSFLTATVTDNSGNTSEFSGIFEILDSNCGIATMNPHILYNRSR